MGSTDENADEASRDVYERNIIDMMLTKRDVRTLDSESLIREVQNHVADALQKGYAYNTTLEESDKFLRKKVLAKLSLVVMYVDLVGSTEMALKLPEDRVAVIISAFAQEMARVSTRHEGRVLKFVGDAVITYFVADGDSLRAADNAVSCAKSMMDVINKGINPILGKGDYPMLRIKIGMDFGTSIVVRYGADEQKSYVDLLGPPMNIAAKIQSHARPNQILAGHDVYTRLHPHMQESFAQVRWEDDEWNYRSRDTGEIYTVYEYTP